MNLFLLMKRIGLTVLMVLLLPVYMGVKFLDDLLGYEPKKKEQKEDGDRRWRNEIPKNERTEKK